MTIVGMLGGTMLLVLILLAVLIVLLGVTPFVVLQQQAYITERFGKFLKVQFVSTHARTPFADRIATGANIHVNQLNVWLEARTLDSVFVTVVASTQFHVNPNDAIAAYYELHDPAGQLGSYMEDALCSTIPALTLDDAFARKDDVAFDMQKTIGAEMSRFGFTVVKTLIATIDPNPQVKNATDSTNAAQCGKGAVRQRVETQHIQIEAQIAANTEKAHLQGEGQANYRHEVISGVVDQIKSLQTVDMNTNDASNIVLLNQYLDVIRSLSESKNTKTMALPVPTPGGYQDLYGQVTKAMFTASKTKQSPRLQIPIYRQRGPSK